MKLTIKQQRFADEYIISGNATEAAKKAGYSKKTARAMGAENLTKPSIKKYIEECIAEIQGPKIATMVEIREFWTSILRDGEERTSDRLKASELMARTEGAFLDRQEVAMHGEMDVNATASKYEKYIMDKQPDGDAGDG